MRTQFIILGSNAIKELGSLETPYTAKLTSVEERKVKSGVYLAKYKTNLLH